MGFDFAKVKAGDRLRIGAPAWNAMLSLVETESRGDVGVGAGPATGAASRTTVVNVKNGSGAAVNSLNVLAIDGVIFSPSDNSHEFKYRTSLTGTTPSATAAGLVITLDPIPNGKVGRAIVAGMAVVQVEVTDASTRFASGKSGSTAKLVTNEEGSVEILWRESGSSGDKWAVVRLAGGGVSRSIKDHIITASTSLGGSLERWRYTLVLGETNTTSGLVTAVSGAPNRVAYNRAEDTTASVNYMHGQELVTDDIELTPGPVRGVVGAWWTGLYDGSGNHIYAFDAPNPMTGECIGGTAGVDSSVSAPFLFMGA